MFVQSLFLYLYTVNELLLFLKEYEIGFKNYVLILMHIFYF